MAGHAVGTCDMRYMHASALHAHHALSVLIGNMLHNAGSSAKQPSMCILWLQVVPCAQRGTREAASPARSARVAPAWMLATSW